MQMRPLDYEEVLVYRTKVQTTAKETYLEMKIEEKTLLGHLHNCSSCAGVVFDA